MLISIPTEAVFVSLSRSMTDSRNRGESVSPDLMWMLNAREGQHAVLPWRIRFLCNCDSAKTPFISRMSTASICVYKFVRVGCYYFKWVVKKAVSGTMDAVFFGVVILQVLTSALSFPSGAPASTCVDMMPRHGAIQPQPNPAPYTIQTSSATLQPEKPITGEEHSEKIRRLTAVFRINILNNQFLTFYCMISSKICVTEFKVLTKLSCKSSIFGIPRSFVMENSQSRNKSVLSINISGKKWTEMTLVWSVLPCFF